jgi:uncharacterized protein (TIGR03435 family)
MPGVSVVFLITLFVGAGQLRFETASVKPASGCSLQNSVDPGMVALNGDPLAVLLTEAFQVKRDQIIGPSWLDTACFAINAKMPEGASKDQLPEMLRSLLVERFKLSAHMETRQRSGYALVVDKNGPRLKQADTDSAYAKAHRGQVTFGWGAHGMIRGAMTMGLLAQRLSTRLGSPVLDLTGLKGIYDVDFSWAPDPTIEKLRPDLQNDAAANSGSADSGPDLFTAIRESLGLSLERRKLEVEVVVIDEIERVPSEN